MDADWKIKANERIKATNEKKQAIRNLLDENSMQSIEDCILACETILESFTNTVFEGHLCVTLDEIIELRNAARTLRFNFCIEKEVL